MLLSTNKIIAMDKKQIGGKNMKLNIGENIRKYRKKAEMTQEQLAEKIGVSYQAISRWENGTTYPDLELLPVLAKLFCVSTDDIFDIPNIKKEEQAENTFKEFILATRKKPIDTNEINSFIRDIRNNYIDSTVFWNFWLIDDFYIYRMPEILPEVRLLFEAIIDGDFEQWIKHEAIHYMSLIEDDEHIEKFISKYATTKDITKDAMLFNRYRYLGNKEKKEPLRQDLLANYIDELIGSDTPWNDPHDAGKPELIPLMLKKNNIQLGLIHSICDQIPDEKHPISANGELDMWIEDRIFHIGIFRVRYLAATGDTEGALVCLEDIVSLFEKAMEITSPTELRCTSQWLDKQVWTAEEWWTTTPKAPALIGDTEVRTIYIHDEKGGCYMLFPGWLYSDLSSTEGSLSHMLDNIRSDPRYTDCTERIKALIKTRPVK